MTVKKGNEAELFIVLEKRTELPVLSHACGCHGEPGEESVTDWVMKRCVRWHAWSLGRDWLKS